MTGLKAKRAIIRSAALFVVLLSIVDFFADFTYEGARSVAGPYLAALGASGTIVGLTAGLGELAGYALRLVSGTIADRTHRYWVVAITGYIVNLFSVPLLAFSGHLPLAVGLLIAERTGRAIRVPARDAMLSHATKEMGRGWGFGLHEAMDQAGAVLGPVLIALVLARRAGYHFGFALLAIPAALAVSTLFIASRLFPHPAHLEIRRFEGRAQGLDPAFWIFLVAAGLIAAGCADFSLMAYHLERTAAVSGPRIPLFYALGMGTHALAALGFGRLYDWKGLKVLVGGILTSLFVAPLVFLGAPPLALLGIGLWGVGLGATESLMRAAVADMSPADRRGTAYGVFYAGYGVLWFLGSVLMGWLYDHSVTGLVIFSVVAQLAALPLVLIAQRRFPEIRAA